MTMTRDLRKLVFIAHVASSAGWMGAVMVFLALALLGLTSQDEGTVRGAYLVMAPAAWLVLVPLAHASLLTGIALSLGTAWGLLQHYWIVLKLAITVFATAVLLIYMGTFREMARIAADPVVDLATVRNASPVVHAIVALFLLALATVLAVYKPLGLTAYGSRKRDEQVHASSRTPVVRGTTVEAIEALRQGDRSVVWIVIALGVALLVLGLLHLRGASLGH